MSKVTWYCRMGSLGPTRDINTYFVTCEVVDDLGDGFKEIHSDTVAIPMFEWKFARYQSNILELAINRLYLRMAVALGPRRWPYGRRFAT